MYSKQVKPQVIFFSSTRVMAKKKKEKNKIKLRDEIISYLFHFTRIL